jgi:hypothetical protein
LRSSHSPLSPSCPKPVVFEVFPAAVNRASVGVHRRSAGSSGPLVRLSLPRRAMVRGDDRSDPATCRHRCHDHLTVGSSAPTPSTPTSSTPSCSEVQRNSPAQRTSTPLPRPPRCQQLSSNPLHLGLFYPELQRGPAKLTGPTDKHPAASSAAECHSHRRSPPPKPSRRRPVTSVSARRLEATRHLPPSMLELTWPPVPWFLRRSSHRKRATVPPRAWPWRADHAACAHTHTWPWPDLISVSVVN